MASAGIGLFFALRDGTTCDRPGAPLVAALAVTLLTGCGVLYLSYFRWDSALAVAAEPPCAALKRLARHQCLKCSGESGLARFFCDESARAEYCADRDGSEPGCPWRTASSTE